TRLGTLGTVDVQVHSITLGANQAAIVRFTRTEREVSTGNVTRTPHPIATMGHQYADVPLTEAVARRNPLGCQVVRYDLAADLSRGTDLDQKASPCLNSSHAGGRWHCCCAWPCRPAPGRWRRRALHGSTIGCAMSTMTRPT